MNRRLRDWSYRTAARLGPWVVVASLVATLDLLAPAGWSVCVGQLTVLLVALQYVARQQVTRLIGVLGGLTLLVGLVRLPDESFQLVRWWVLSALIAAAAYHYETQRRRRSRLKVRQQLQRRVRRRSLQIRRINAALRREIARRQETQQRLNRAETHLESLAQRMQLQVIRKDLNGVITYANEAFCRGIGKSADEVIGSTDADLYPAAVAAAYRADDERVVLTGEPVDHIESHPEANGKKGWVQVFKAPEYDDQDQVIGIQMVFWDVTDTYEKTAELRHSEARKRALFEAAREAVLLVDEREIVVEANPAAEALLSLSGRELVGERLDRIAIPEATLVDAAQPTDASGLAAWGRNGRAETNSPPMGWTDLPFGQRREVLLRLRGEASFPAEVSVHPIPLENSFGMAIFIRDVTLRHRAVEALHAAKVAAEEASRIKSEFMASVSHEIRTPLGGITGSAELLSLMDLAPKARQYVQMIRTSGELLSGVIGDILDLASIEAGRLRINPVPTDLHRCLGEPFRALATRAIGKDLELILEIDAAVPRWALVDANRLRQVVINLAGNAIKFTPQGYVRFHVEPAEPGWLKFEMSDSGIGIAEDRLEKIFEPFEQGDSGTTRRFGGTGLGLSISEQLIRRMGGSIEVTSRPGHGSLFCCRLPLPPLTEEQAKDVHLPDQPSPDRAAPPAVNQRVALDIPHPLQRRAIQGLLTDAGYRIDPRAAVRIVDQSVAGRQRRDRRMPDGTRIRTLWLARVDEPAPSNQDPMDPVLIKPILADDLLAWLHQDPSSMPDESPDTSHTPSDRPPQTRSAALIAPTVAHSPVADEPFDEKMPSAAAASSNDMNRQRLLLVDDSPVNRSVIREFLLAAGYEIELACDGAEAIAATAANRFDAILMDLQMPGMDGIETMRAIVTRDRDQQRTPPPFIALTAHATQEHRKRCLDEGMRAFLVKPIDRVELLRTVASILTAVVTQPPATEPIELVNLRVGEPPQDAALSVEQAGETAEDWYPRLLQVAGNDPRVAEICIEAFLTEVPGLSEDLSGAIDAQDAAAGKRAAHTLKSCLRYVAPEADSNLAATIEQTIERQDWLTASELLDDVQAAARRWLEALSAPSDRTRSRHPDSE